MISIIHSGSLKAIRRKFLIIKALRKPYRILMEIKEESIIMSISKKNWRVKHPILFCHNSLFFGNNSKSKYCLEWRTFQ